MAIHLVLKPLIKELTAAVKSVKGGPDGSNLEQRVQELEDLTSVLQHDLTRAVEAADFHKALKAVESTESNPTA